MPRIFGATEFAITRAIIELRQRNDYISAQMIADHISCERHTVHKALKRLIDQGQVLRGEGSKRGGGYKYDYVGTR